MRKVSVGLAILLSSALLPPADAVAQSDNSFQRFDPTLPQSRGMDETLALTPEQKALIWNDIKDDARNQTAPGFNPTIGGVIPPTITTAPVPLKTATDVPPLRPYNFVMLDDKLVIVNPVDKKIVQVIEK
jgi:hypothetical protein